VDVHDLSRDVLRHRIVLTYDALADGVTAEQLLDHMIAEVPMPRIELSRAESAA
jgi:MoxR-like ATPase